MSTIAARSPARRVSGRPFTIRHFPPVLLAGLLIVAALLVLHISVGTVDVSPGDVVNVLTGQQTAELTHTVVWELRLPRALVAICAGAMLALAGAILQSLTGNPLAEPDLTGASAGGVLFAVLWLSRQLVGWSTAPPSAEVALIALLGAMASGGLVYALSWQRRTSAVRLVLTGVLVATIMRALTSLVLLRNQNAIGGIVLWIIGSLNGRTWTHWDAIWPWALVGLPLGLVCAGAANGLQLGDDIAAGLGMRVERVRALLLFVAVLLTAGAVSVVGALAFLGLIAPHLARRIAGDDARRVFPLSAVMGAILLLVADIVSRSVAQPNELPVGALMSLLGAPFLMFLLWRGIR